MEEATGTKKLSRIFFIDEIRGIVIISMLLFHAAYDARYLYEVGCSWFSGTLQTVWQATIGWTFVFIAGMSTQFSRNGFKRFLKLAIVAVAISLVTGLTSVDDMIKFGVIHLLAFCALVYLLLERYIMKIPALPGAAVFFLLFLVTYGVSEDHIGFLNLIEIPLPQSLYTNNIFAWLGFPSPTYVDGDYFPVIPYVFLYLCGALLSVHFTRIGFPAWTQRNHVPALSFIGRHTLIIYLLHQPILLLLFELATKSM